MSSTPTDLRYTRSHEWIRQHDDGTVTLGITDHAQAALGDIVFLELPEPDQAVSAGGELAVVESVKAASDIYAPIDGTVLAVNDTLEEAPETVNEDCYGDGWMVRLQVADPAQLQTLLDAEAYAAALGDD
ncbi:glycine cleavage system protein GcvH [Natronospirillum operosum]|uniref:Glycine cleavage system H protein n=1 Tax=Natronospirillum operosum TaxID=2759953 RepID=A0A4Z0WDV9_9GAMM|nr:glycine cleavage system protein GcvH [Natronospirillum operosum]TGG93346.1 glycine cleavage system protein GcvH [Natronospirillum operosum]